MLLGYQCIDVTLNDVNSATFTTCTLSGNTITITGVFTASSSVYNAIVTIGGIVNPAFALTTSAFVGTIGSDSSNNSTKADLNLLPALLSGISVTFSGKTVNKTSDMIVTLQTTNQIPANGSITVLFPSTVTWARDISTTHLIPINGILSCYGITSNINNSSIQCSGLYSTATVTITSISNASIPAGSTIQLGIQNLFSPPTTEPVDQLTVTTYDSLSNQIDYQSSTISGLVP